MEKKVIERGEAVVDRHVKMKRANEYFASDVAGCYAKRRIKKSRGVAKSPLLKRMTVALPRAFSLK